MGEFDFMFVLLVNLRSHIGIDNIHPIVNRGVKDFSHLMKTELPFCFMNSR
jgi:hypothetical protein